MPAKGNAHSDAPGTAPSRGMLSRAAWLPSRSTLFWFLAAAAVPLAICWMKLDDDLWYDEVYTLTTFVSQPFTGIVTDYSVPNNHVFYSLLMRPVLLLGESSGWLPNAWLRFPSFVFTVGTLALTFALGKRLASGARSESTAGQASSGAPESLNTPSVAVIATAWLGLTQMFLNHTTGVRGYSLSMMLTTLLAWLAVARVREQDRTSRMRAGLRGLAIVLVGAALVYTMPTNVLFLMALASVAAIVAALDGRRTSSALLELVGWVAAGLLAALLYWPIAHQVLAASGHGPRPSLSETGQTLAAALAAATYDTWPLLILGIIALAFSSLSLRERAGVRAQLDRPRTANQPGMMLALLCTLWIAVPLALTVILGIRPFARTFCPMLPAIALAGGAMVVHAAELAQLWLKRTLGTTALLDKPAVAPGSLSARGTALLLALLTLGLGVRLWNYPARLEAVRNARFAQDGYYDYYAANYHPARLASYLAEHLQFGQPYHIYFEDADSFALEYYLSQAQLPPNRRAAEGEAIARWVIMPPLPDYAALAKKAGATEQQLRTLPPVADFGYYRLYRLPSPDPKSL